MQSIQTGGLRNVMYLRRDLIRRPIAPVLDEPKIDRMMETMSREYDHAPQALTDKGKELYAADRPIPESEIDAGRIKANTDSDSDTFDRQQADYDDMTPIDVLTLSHKGQPYYFGFGGCHRFQAYDRSNWDLIKVKIVPITKNQLKLYMGSSVDSLFED